jgi:hypothetical protein
MTPHYHKTGDGTYDITIDGADVIATVQVEDGGWTAWVPETSPRPHQRLLCVRNSRAEAAAFAIAWVQGQGRA